jgi:L-arabinose transport system substrate-binding protein
MKKVLAFLLTVAMCLPMAACSTDSSTSTAASAATYTAASDAASTATSTAAAATKVLHDRNGDGKLVIYGIYKSGDQTWFLNEGKAAKATVEAAGGTFYYVDVATDPEKYQDAVKNAIANKADGIVTCTPDQTLSKNIVDLCTEAKIPVVACDDALEADGKKIAPWVGIDGYSIGCADAKWLTDYIAKNNLTDDKACGILIMTMNTTSSCVPRTNGESETINKTYPQFKSSKRLFTCDYDGTTDKGNSTSAAIFTGNPQITKWIVCGANEEGVVGAVRALETAGLDKNACAVGMGAYLAKDEYKKGSCMKAAAFFSDVAIGQGSVNTVFDLIDGKNVKLETAVEAKITTPDNYTEIMGDEAK